MNTKHISKPDKRIRPPGARRSGLWISLILLIAILIAGYWLWPCLNNAEPRFNYLKIVKDGESLNLLNGETIRFHPRDRVKVLKISTNICFNRGVRLVTEGPDINSLLYDELSLGDLLPDKEIYGTYTFRIEVKRYNQEIGHVDIIIEPLVEDWLDKADRSIEVDGKIETLKKALEIFPDERRIKDRLVKDYTSANKWSEAAVILEGMVRDKLDKTILENLLDLYEKMSSKDGVISVLKRLVQLSPDDMALRLSMAVALEDAGKSNDAMMEYEGLLDRMRPQDLLPVYNGLGYLYAEAGENDKAISFYLKALELNREDANIYYNLSLLYEKTGQKDKANQYLAKVVELKPDSQGDNLRLIENLLEAGNPDKALPYLKQYVESKPDDADARSILFDIYKGQKKDDLAYEEASAIIKLKPSETDCYQFIFDYLSKKKRYRDMAGIMEAGVKANPKDVNVRKYLIVSYLKTGKEDKALTQIKAVLDLTPDDTAMLMQLAKLYEKQDKTDEALAAYRKVLDISPDNQEAEEAYLELRLKTLPK